jgi:curved DNA-binding protein CbpA
LSQFDSNKNYYAVLGVAENASRREIERLYRRLAQRKHPDRGGSEEEMKALNEAYQVLRDDAVRNDYDHQRRKPPSRPMRVRSAPAARDVGVYGQSLSAVICTALGFMLLLLVRFNGLWFLWPLAILAVGVMLFGVLIAHSAVDNARSSLRRSHPARRFRAAQEVMFWTLVAGGGYGVYVILTAF